MSGDRAAGTVEVRCIACGDSCRPLFRKSGYDIVRCPGCGLGTVSPLPSPETLEAFYAETYYGEGSGGGYQTEYGELEAGLKKMYGRFLDTVLRAHPGRRFARILDVGCAYGFFLDVAEARCRPDEVVGLDVSPEARDHALARGRTFHAGFFEAVELPEAHFDLVFMGDAIEHVHDPVLVARKLARVLAPGGVLVLSTVDFGSWLARALGARWRLLTPPEHLFFWTRPSLERVLADAGLVGKLGNYWLFYPKSYVYQRTRAQFGFAPRFLALLPGDLVPVPSFDAMWGVFERTP